VFNKRRNDQRQGWRAPRWWVLSAMGAMLFVAACSHGNTSTARTATSTSPTGTGGTPVTVPNNPKNLHITPVPGTYSVYVDPTYGYSVQYPVTWFVTPGIGPTESNVEFDEPITNVYDPSFPTHPVTLFFVRATTYYNESFVEQLLCGASFDTKVGPYPAVTLDTWGGDPTDGYTAPAFGRAFYAKGKAFEIWLQSSAKDYISSFFQIEQPLWDHILKTFNPGPQVKPAAQC
jgi:hypothetical protein